MKKIYDNTYKYTTIFDSKNGFYLRAYDVDFEPFMAEAPHLIDIGIMGGCVHGKSGLCLKAGIQCYQNAPNVSKPNMTLENYKKILNEVPTLTQVALGGAGDPDMHENFEDILKYSREKDIVPNFTTSGLGMTPEKAKICKKYCGAVAVSMYSRLDMIPEVAYKKVNNNIIYENDSEIPAVFTFGGINPNCVWNEEKGKYLINDIEYDWDELHHVPFGKEDKYQYYRIFKEKNENSNYTMKAINMLLDAGVTTSIHYVLGKNTIDEAILRLKNNGFPKGIYAVIFLLHKNVGLGTESNVLNYNDPKVKEFFNLIDKGNFSFKIGFDSCSIPGILNFCSNIDTMSVDTCEGGRYSMYISADMVAYPCSFDNQDKVYAYQMDKNHGVIDAWNSEQFEHFRSYLRNSCPSCSKRNECMGGCPLRKNIVLCNSKDKSF